jgi:hypothetical protein
MKQLSQPTAASPENPIGELDQLKSFVHDLAAAIVSNASEFEGVWNITNRVYDRWVYGHWVCDQPSPPGKVTQLRRERDRARSA